MDRPPLIAAPSQGLLRTEHFQMAWATNDLERAKELFQHRYGIQNWTPLGGPNKMGGEIQIHLAWVGTIMYELMWAGGPGSEIYMGRLPAGEGFAIRHHHLGYLIDSEDEWNALLSTAKGGGHHVPHLSPNPGFMTSCFVDAPELGHYLEYIWAEEAGQDFFANVARN